MEHTSVCASIVVHSNHQALETCLRSVFEQTHPPREVIVVDNASTRRTREILARFKGRIRVIRNDSNVGFAAAQNQAIASSASDWMLVLTRMRRCCRISSNRLLEGGRIDPRVGTVCGRLLACHNDLTPLEEPLIDSAGIYFTPEMRHFDRGWHEPDDGRFRRWNTCSDRPPPRLCIAGR